MPGNGAAGASYGDLLVTSLVVLGGVCIAAFVVVRLVGRFLATGRSRGAHLLDVVARLPLEPRRSLYVVEVAGKTLLVGTSEMGLSVLSELDGGEVRARVAERPSFGELVRSAWQRRRGASHHEAPERDRQDQASPHLFDPVDPVDPAARAAPAAAAGPTAPAAPATSLAPAAHDLRSSSRPPPGTGPTAPAAPAAPATSATSLAPAAHDLRSSSKPPPGTGPMAPAAPATSLAPAAHDLRSSSKPPPGTGPCADEVR